MESFLDIYKQNKKLPIRLISPISGHLSPDIIKKFGYAHRKNHYFLLFMLEGNTHHRIDLKPYDVERNQLLFILPHQIHQVPITKHGTDYFKLGFDETCLSLLPKQYPFLIDPCNNQKISLTPPVVSRLKSIFEILRELLNKTDTDPDLILAHLNSLLTEINFAYFFTGKSPAGEKLSKYTQFKLFIEDNLTSHLTVNNIAEKLSLNANSLYNIVKHYSGISPKEFITNRLILEAKRRLYYSESSSIKELAYDLGFNDPEYFARLFKKVTGKTITMFVQDLSGK